MLNPKETDWAGEVAGLVDEHGEMVFGAAYRILGKTQDAEDVFQEVFLKLLRRPPRRGRPETVRDWGPFLRVMTTRRAIDALRRKRTRKQVQVEDIEGFHAPPSEGPRATAQRNELAPLLRQAISALPRRESMVISLRHFDEFTYDQISTHLGISTGSVGVILHRARKHLRDILAPILASPGSSEPRAVAAPAGDLP